MSIIGTVVVVFGLTVNDEVVDEEVFKTMVCVLFSNIIELWFVKSDGKGVILLAF